MRGVLSVSVNISEKKIKSKVKTGERVAVVENIKYPYFESEKHKKLCSKMNEFYSSVAEKYSFHARNKLPKKIKLSRLTCKLPMTVSMNYTIALCSEKAVSVVLDIAFAEGKTFRTRRFSQVWGIEKKDILRIGEIINIDRQSTKKIYSYISAVAKENSENPAFGYFDDYAKRLSRSFERENCFLVPNGLCFFINAGVLSPLKYGANSFVLPFSKLDGIIKGDFLTKNDKTSAQNTDIVNNV